MALIIIAELKNLNKEFLFIIFPACQLQFDEKGKLKITRGKQINTHVKA